MSNGLLKNIKLLEQTADRPIIIHQHSMGGEWDAGMMMYDIIKTCEQQVIIITHGSACSMGTIIPLAADLVICMPSCFWLLHSGTTDINDQMTYKQSRSWSKYEKIQQNTMMEIYTNACRSSKLFSGKTDKQITNYLNRKLDYYEDWWISANELVDLGFCDGIYGSKGYENLEEIIKHVH
jgi:ATP-dependent protease ClpP protease subunit